VSEAGEDALRESRRVRELLWSEPELLRP